MKKLVALFVLVLFLPIATPANFNTSLTATKIEVFDAFGNKIMEKEVTYEEAEKIQEDLLKGNVTKLGLKFDFIAPTLLISYGRGKVYIPLHRDRTFFRLFLRPVFFNYEEGFTFVKFGANYIWKGKSLGDYGLMLRNQFGMMLGFFGLHIKIPYKLKPDMHIFIGSAWIMVGWDKFL